METNLLIAARISQLLGKKTRVKPLTDRSLRVSSKTETPVDLIKDLKLNFPQINFYQEQSGKYFIIKHSSIVESVDQSLLNGDFDFLRELLHKVDSGTIDWRRLSDEVGRLTLKGIPMIINNFLFKEAIRQNAFELVKIMLHDPAIDPTDSSEMPPDAPKAKVPIKLAAERGWIDIVRLLLTYPQVNPTYGLIGAIGFDHYETAALLLDDPRTICDEHHLIFAIERDYYDLFEKIVSKFNPIPDQNRLLAYAGQFGAEKITLKLLQDPLIDPNAYQGNSWIMAARNGHEKTLRLLLQDPRVNPSAYNNRVIHAAVLSGNLNVVKLLMADPRVDPSIQNNLPLKVALKNKNYEMASYLYQNSPRVRQEVDNEGAVMKNLLKTILQ